MANNNRQNTQSPSSASSSPLVSDPTEFSSAQAPKIRTVDIPTDMPVVKSNKVEVDKDVLDTILKEISDLKQKTSEFESTASQDQTRKIESMRASGKLVKSVKIRRFDGDLVVGWVTTEDKVWMEGQKLHEIQNIKVFTDNGEKDTTLVQFTRGCLYETYEVIAETKTVLGDLEMTIMMKDGKKLVINSKYVN